MFSVDPLEKFAQFIRKYGTGAVAEQLFERIIGDDTILWNMTKKAMDRVAIPKSTIPFLKRHYYAFALNSNGALVLAHCRA